ncbi:MAG: DNA (cytosine-5-)-methyltransferase [Methylotenera sp.]|nr:DNA (cytosine-5-)-methyltransferase [Methylotenera sp.]MDO9389013.1 DNA (cytosine-5-)-methyltransferase [Methylotenera sp.]
MQEKSIPVVDLFAGPGGLGEGFSRSNNGRNFEIIVSAEMDQFAVKTLRLRAFFRILQKQAEHLLEGYYRFCAGEKVNFTEYPYQTYWEQASNEARQLTLGNSEDNRTLDGILREAKISSQKSWVLIGGPPCQAYSLAGRARNKRNTDYKPEEDHRNYLYKEYLRIIHDYRPAVFVMENVKGILSSNVDGKKIFHSILLDLSDPDEAISKSTGVGYRICSLVNNTVFKKGMSPDEIDPKDFIVKAENYGLPQARHRVILLGIREDLAVMPEALQESARISVNDVISDLPALRSGLSKEMDTQEAWSSAVNNHLQNLISLSSQKVELKQLNLTLKELRKSGIPKLNKGAVSIRKHEQAITPNNVLSEWYSDSQLKAWLNHETRGHMSSDLLRYFYVASYGIAYGQSPKGHKEFDLEGLSPNHKNWKSGNFSDRFRVQINNRPSTTITSHISKDGHQFIHPDPLQCRSLTVREASRLQTFPDNYFFQGNRTQQFHQVGNAVPPLLAYQIAGIVKKLFN